MVYRQYRHHLQLNILMLKRSEEWRVMLKQYLGNFEFVKNILKYFVILDHIVLGLSIKIDLQQNEQIDMLVMPQYYG